MGGYDGTDLFGSEYNLNFLVQLGYLYGQGYLNRI